jgi:hypothetical protein
MFPVEALLRSQLDDVLIVTFQVVGAVVLLSAPYGTR